ncbi:MULTISPECIES: aKG-HExxH-type peptide beta-hydroxylase [Exiguobacterium]|uniref:aKG-HExxH-type peptide beta-hydroxylase n=1 Tax=Exiguobacterium TaxID=33986 RepID=UPI000B2CBD27|nr:MULTISPECIES: HEXXH motif-containing putative peptide modification protein [Exiguobacterium]
MTTLVEKTKTDDYISFLHKTHINNNIEAIFQFASSFRTMDKELSSKELTLKEKYFESVNLLQDVSVPYDNHKIHLTFFDKTLQSKLLELGMIDSEDLENDNHIYSPEKQEQIRYRMTQALNLINSLHPELGNLVNQLVGTFLILKKDLFGGGSVSNVLGLIWLNPQEEWTIIDYAEAIYHEFIHQSIFLDDMINCMFPNANDCAKEEALVTSTILKMRRPLDRSYHAAGVSIGIMHLYHLFNDKSKSVQFIDDLKVTLSEISTKTEFLGEQGIIALEQMNSFAKNVNYDLITESLNK